MTHQQTLSGRAWAELILLAVIWGGSFLAFAIALRALPVFALAAHRVCWAALLMWATALILRWPLPGPRFWLPCLVMGLLNNVIPFSLIAWGQIRVESGLASIFNASTALFGVLLAAMIFPDERLTGRKAIGTGLGFAGVTVAIGPDSLSSFDIRSVSQLAIIAATLSYGLAACWARATLRPLDPKAAALGMLTASSLCLLALSFWFDGPTTLSLSGPTWASIAFLSIFATFLAYLLYYRVLATAGAGNLMLVTLLIPPIAIALGAAVLGEDLPATAFIGLGIIALGMVILDGRALARLPFSIRRSAAIETGTTAPDRMSDDLSDPTRLD